jgi:hypothetical protein
MAFTATSSVALLSFSMASALAAHPPYIPTHDPRLDEDGPWLYVEKQSRADAFRQLEEILPTPNDQRTASGAPGAKYWQQRADHVIKARLDETRHAIEGTERIRYHNNSPDALSYLWLQVDQNHFRGDSIAQRAEPAPDLTKEQPISWLRGVVFEDAWRREGRGGYDIRAVRDDLGGALPFTVVETMMRVDLPKPLASGATIEFEIDFAFDIVWNEMTRARSAYELLRGTNAPIYDIAQWFPRMAAYTDVNGWQHKQFLGSGEFTTEFGDYHVELDVPDTFVVAATGELANADAVLTPAQRERLAAARTAARPEFVITPDEAGANETSTPTGRKTWVFKAENVRDFAWAASPAFAWDAWGVPVPGTDRTALAMSFYPKLAASLWSVYSTQAVAHTIDSYSRHAYPYPYPVAISVNGPVGGMEYPMISFNGPRPEDDGTWSKGAKYGLVSVVIHEVGHNWFPMIINSDERQWTWMDEGLNTFCQYLAEQEWEEKYPSGRGEPYRMVEHMTSKEQTPIMTNSESVLQFGPNQYGKPATALNVLRESVLGRELFDFAFREYCRRWAFKRPEPADLFRTLEDASGTDLDWFWRGWFYSTDHCDVSVERVVSFAPKGLDVDADKARDRAKRDADRDATLAVEGNRDLAKRVERYPELKDFYSTFDELEVTPADRRSYERFLEDLDAKELEALKTTLHFTVVRLRNLGGLVTFVPVLLTFDDGTTQYLRLPAEIWRRNAVLASKLFVTEKPVAKVEIDPRRETADADRANNEFPQAIRDEAFAVTKGSKERNPMQLRRDEERREECERIAKALAPVFLARWNGVPEDRWPTPLDVASELTALAREQNLLVAPDGSTLTIEFANDRREAGQSPDRLRLATVVLSAKPIGPEPTDKTKGQRSEPPLPARFAIYFDGSVRPDRGGRR